MDLKSFNRLSKNVLFDYFTKRKENDMKILIAEDDFIARRALKEIINQLGDCDVVIDGEEAVEAFRLAWEENDPYDLICLDIMMPNMDGKEALKNIRDIEKTLGIKGSKEVKVIMVTALGDPKTVFESYYQSGATSYVVKPVDKDKLINEIRSLGLID